MKRWTWLCLLAFALAATAAQAERTVVPVPIPADAPRYTLNARSGAVGEGCLLGNGNAPAYYISGWFTGGEAYKFLFHPQQTNGCAITSGFTLAAVHMYMYFTAPCPLGIWVDLEDADWDPGRNCFVPGPEDYTSASYTVDVPGPGLYDISIPISGGCAFMNYQYGISVHFWTVDCATPPAIVVDGGPIQPCTNWNDWGQGWQDLADYGFTWNLAMYADAYSCENPVPGDRDTWGNLKQMYR